MGEDKVREIVPALSSVGGTTADESTLPQGQALLDIIAAIRSTGTTSSADLTPAATPTEEKNDSKGVSKNELAVTLQICGQSSTGEVTDLPDWIQDFAAKGTIEHYKLMII